MVIFMKKKVLIFTAIAICIIAIVLMIGASIKLKSDKINEDKHLVKLSIPDLQKKVADKDTFVLVVTQSKCSHCASYKPKIKKVLTKHDIIGYEIVLDELDASEKGLLRDIANTEGNGTPTTVFIIDGEEQRTSTRLIGDQEESNIENRLRQLKFIE